jgi:hypothetical protein
MKEVRVARSARKHRVSIESILTALENAGEPIKTAQGQHPGETSYTFIGTDSHREEVEIVAIDQPNMLLVIHAIPTKWRKK